MGRIPPQPSRQGHEKRAGFLLFRSALQQGFSCSHWRHELSPVQNPMFWHRAPLFMAAYARVEWLENEYCCIIFCLVLSQPQSHSVFSHSIFDQLFEEHNPGHLYQPFPWMQVPLACLFFQFSLGYLLPVAFEIGYHYTIPTAFKLILILLTQTSEYQDYRPIPPCLAGGWWVSLSVSIFLGQQDGPAGKGTIRQAQCH